MSQPRVVLTGLTHGEMLDRSAVMKTRRGDMTLALSGRCRDATRRGRGER